MKKRRKQWTLEPLEARSLLAVITVNSALDASAPNTVMTLRQAINISNGSLPISSLTPQQQAQVAGTLSSPNSISFNIPGSGVQTIAPTSALPFITSPVIINGYTQPGASPNTSTTTDNAVLLIQLSGANAGPNADGLFINGLSASNTTISGLIFNNWGVGGHVAGQPGGRAIDIFNSGGGNVITGNFIGTDSTGMSGVTNTVGGIQVDHSIADTIGGPNPADRNVILVGGTFATGAPNVWGIYVTGSTQTAIQGNFIGVNTAGNQFTGYAPAGGIYGISIVDSTGVGVGGGSAGYGNVLNSVWIGTLSGTVYQSNSFVAGNTIGFNASRTANLNNSGGVVILNAAGNLIGGNTAATGNLIGAAGGVGIDVVADNHAANLNTLIQGNTIGAIPPTSNVFRGFDGIRLASSGNTIGGLNAGLGNNIQHNTSFGVEVYNLPSGTTPTSGYGIATNNKILSNIIFDSGLGSIGTSSPAPQTPVMKLVAPTPNGTLLLTGVIGHAVPGAAYLIQFYTDLNPSKTYPVEAERILTTEKFTAAANGLILFSTVVPAGRVPAGSVIIASATPVSGGNTSQFSAGVPVGAPVSSAVILNITSGTPKAGQPLTIAANVASDAVNWVSPTGKMVLFDKGVALAVTDVVGTGYGYFTIPKLSSGSHSFVVKYSGDAIFPGATSAPTNINAGAAVVAPPRVVSVQRVTLTAGQVGVSVTFDSPLDPSTANNINNYQFVALRAQGTGYVAAGNPFGVTSATYNTSTNTVTLVPSIGLSTTTLYAITVQGVIRNTRGVLLDGAGNNTPGSNYYGRV